MTWDAPDDWPQIETVESHTGGEPLRVVVDGFPDIEGETMLEKRRQIRANQDEIRTGLMLEPRGHADMYGALLTDSVTEDGDVGVLFMHNNGYSTMCGHGVIALGAVLPVIGAVDVSAEDPNIRLDTPAGRVVATPTLPEDQPVERVTFENVPAYVVDLGAEVTVPQYGAVAYDLAYGGAYYAYCDVAQFGLSLAEASTAKLVKLGRDIKTAIADTITIEHPNDEDQSFLYGVILVDEPQSEGDIRNVCIFADGEVDRSPTGTGVSGHLAIQYERGNLGINEPFVVESIIGSTFTGRITNEVDYRGESAVVPEVTGNAYITGTATYSFDPSDPFTGGFSLR